MEAFQHQKAVLALAAACKTKYTRKFDPSALHSAEWSSIQSMMIVLKGPGYLGAEELVNMIVCCHCDARISKRLSGPVVHLQADPDLLQANAEQTSCLLLPLNTVIL